MTLDRAQIQDFEEEGYLLFPALLAEERRRLYLARFAELVERARAMARPDGHFSLAPDADGKPIPGLLHKVQGVCVVDARALELAGEPAILDRVEALIGPNIDMFGSKFFPMLVPGATSTGWHQDNHYFGTRSDRIVSCAIYLEDTDRENGCLQVVPGSHRTEELATHVAGKGVYAHGAWTEVDERQAVDIVCPGGTVVLFSANLLHGARPNRSERTSFRTAWHYIPGDLDLPMFPRGVYPDRHILRGK